MATKTENNMRIALYTRRTLGEKINVAIDFLRQNWSVALRFSIYLLLPLALIQSVGLFTLVRSITNDNYTSSDISAVFSIIIFVIVSCLIYTLILTLFQYYQGSSISMRLRFFHIWPFTSLNVSALKSPSSLP